MIYRISHNLKIFITFTFVITTLLFLLPSVYAQTNASNSVLTTLITSTSDSSIPIGVNQNHSFLVWQSNITGNSEIMFVKHTNGAGFSARTDLSQSPDAESVNPSIAVDGKVIYVTWWEKYHNGVQVPMYVQSTDNGTTFGAVTMLSFLK